MIFILRISKNRISFENIFKIASEKRFIIFYD